MVASRLDSAAPTTGLAPVSEFNWPKPSAYERSKRAIDLMLACMLLALAAPVIAVAWALVRLTSVGPGFYSQCRIGRYGEPFIILKLRSMYHRCETASGVRWATSDDDRVTPIGRFLRRLHIDELPQLFNVLRGDMSLVGPRPERPEFVHPLTEMIPKYSDRLRMRPGLTGLAQVQLPPDSSLESVRRKLVLDLHYMNCRGHWLDVRLMAATGLYLTGLPYDVVRRALWLPNPLVSALAIQTLIDTDIDPNTR